MAMPRDELLCIMSKHKQVWYGQDWSCSRLVEYLSYDYWSPHIGLCTLSGFDHRCCEKGDSSAPANFNFASALDPGAFMSYKNENSEAEEQLLTRMNEDIDRLRGFWENSGNDIEDRKYPPAFFIEWAISKTFTPDWLKWAIRTGRDIPKQEVDKTTQAGAPATEVEADTNPSGDDVEEQAADADGHDETLAALFDPLPVEALAQMFRIDLAQWKKWQDKAKANGLSDARQGTALFNPYKAGVWLVRKGAQGWDYAHLYRTLVKNLPARSLDDAHLLTGGID